MDNNTRINRLFGLWLIAFIINRFTVTMVTRCSMYTVHVLSKKKFDQKVVISGFHVIHRNLLGNRKEIMKVCAYHSFAAL